MAHRAEAISAIPIQLNIVLRTALWTSDPSHASSVRLALSWRHDPERCHFAWQSESVIEVVRGRYYRKLENAGSRCSAQTRRRLAVSAAKAWIDRVEIRSAPRFARIRRRRASRYPRVCRQQFSKQCAFVHRETTT